MNLGFRLATSADAVVVAAISQAARIAALPQVRWAHTAAEVERWIADFLLPTHEVWLAEIDAAPVGFMALQDDWVDQLYLDPAHWRRGIGSSLIGLAKSRAPGRLQLWCFQVNLRARIFYEAHGFTPERFTDGTDNEEREPDVLYAWQDTSAASGAASPPRP
jgi:GNAT superfamily N-acetyltransferase